MTPEHQDHHLDAVPPEDIQLFRISNGTVSSDTESADTESFAQDFAFMEHYGQVLGGCIGMTELHFGALVENRATMVFRYERNKVNGAFVKKSIDISTILREI